MKPFFWRPFSPRHTNQVTLSSHRLSSDIRMDLRCRWFSLYRSFPSFPDPSLDSDVSFLLSPEFFSGEICSVFFTFSLVACLFRWSIDGCGGTLEVWVLVPSFHVAGEAILWACSPVTIDSLFALCEFLSGSAVSSSKTSGPAGSALLSLLSFYNSDSLARPSASA